MSASCEQVITLAGDLHARPAGALAVAAGRFASAVSVTAGSHTADAKSVLGVMGLGATSGQHVTVSAAGPDAQEAVAALITILTQATKVGGLLRNQAGRCTRSSMNVAKGDCRTPLGSSQASVKGALQRARATLEARLPAGREHAPPPGSPRGRQLAGRFAAAVETSDIDAVLDLLTSDAWLTMPPEPYEYQGRAAIARFLHHRASLRGAPLRLAPTRANPQPAFGCYRPCPQAPIARPYGMIVLTLEDDRICAITWFSDSSVFPQFGLPRTLPR